MNGTDERPDGPRDTAPRLIEIGGYVLCAALALAALFVGPYPVGADLPQHVAQVDLWRAINHGEARAAPFEVNHFTPYWLGYWLLRALGVVLPPILAVRVLLAMVVLALPLSLRFFCRELGLPTIWALSGFPLAFGAVYQWGFLNNLVAMPLAVAALTFAVRFSRRQRLTDGLVLAATLGLLFWTHVLPAVLTALLAAFLVLTSRPSVRAAARALWPLGGLIVFALPWFLLVRSEEGQTDHVTIWQAGLERLPRMFSDLLGAPATIPYVAAGLLLVCLPLFTGARITRRWQAWLPGYVCLLLFLAAPTRVFGALALSERIAFFLVPSLWLTIEPPPRLRPARVVLVVTACAALLVWNLGRTVALAADGRDFQTATAAMPQHARTVSLVFEPSSPSSNAPLFLHFPVWSQVTNGGVVEPSFAMFYNAIVRYRPGRGPDLPAQLEWQPESFDLADHGEPYDAVVVRSRTDRTSTIDAGATGPDAETHAGAWWLYRLAERGVTDRGD